MNRRELFQRRVLGAVRFVHRANGLPVPHALQLAPTPTPGALPDRANPALRLRRNRAGLYVVLGAPGFAPVTAAFTDAELAETRAARVAAGLPASLDLRLRVTDPTGHFLPRDFALPVPLDLAAPIQPLDVALYPAASADLAEGWAVLRVRVERELEAPAGGGGVARVPVPGALIRVLRGNAGNTVLGRGLTEWRQESVGPRPNVGEALVVVPDIPLLKWSNAANGNVLDPNQAVRFEVRCDQTFTPLPPRPVREDRERWADPIPDVDALEAWTVADGEARILGRVEPTGDSIQARDRLVRRFVFNSELTQVRLA